MVYLSDSGKSALRVSSFQASKFSFIISVFSIAILKAGSLNNKRSFGWVSFYGFDDRFASPDRVALLFAASVLAGSHAYTYRGFVICYLNGRTSGGTACPISTERASSLPKPVEQPVINQTGLFIFFMMLWFTINELISMITVTTPIDPRLFILLGAECG